MPLQRYSNIIAPRQAVTSLTFTEAATLEGSRYNQFFDLEYAAGETKFFFYYIPRDKNKAMAIQKRIFKTKDGSAELEILWEINDPVTPGEPATIYNQNNKYVDDSAIQVSEVTGIIGGTVREVDFVLDTGVFFASNGDLSEASGARVYNPESYFVVKVTNTHSATNRILLAYSWVEIPSTFLKV